MHAYMYNVYKCIIRNAHPLKSTHAPSSTHILEDWFPLFSGADGIRAAHDQTLRVDAQVLAVSRLQGYSATAPITRDSR